MNDNRYKMLIWGILVFMAVVQLNIALSVGHIERDVHTWLLSVVGMR